jgi:annexin A7/11
MSEVEELEKAITSKNDDEITKITLNHTNAQRVKLREDYQAKYSRDLIKDLEDKFSGEFRDCLVGLYKSPAEFDADLLYKAMKGAGSDKEVMTEVVCFRSPEEFESIKAKFQEKYGKDLISEIKDECSGDYRKIILALLDNKRVPNSNPDLENCTKIAKELYDAGEGKIGTNEEVFIKYFTTLSPEELLLVCKEYHKNHKRNMLDSIEEEFSSHTKDLLKIVLYSLYSPSEFYARTIQMSIAGAGTADNKLIRSIIARSEKDMAKIKKYYKKIYDKDMIEDVNNDTSGSYKNILNGLMQK